MNITLRRGAFVALMTISTACGSPTPTAPTQSSLPVAASPAPPTPTTIPPLSGPSRTFVFDRGLMGSVANYTSKSRFVFYDNGAFVLQYVSLGIEYRGVFTEADGVITFQWEGWSLAGFWGATGVVNGNSLTVRYNHVMQMDDFEDAVYSLDPAQQK